MHHSATTVGSMLIPRTLALITIVALAVLSSKPAAACSCALRTQAVAKSAATVIVEAELVRFEPAATDVFTVGVTQVAVFRVHHVWRGIVNREVRVLVAQPSMCPPTFIVGARIVIYPTGPRDALRIEACSRVMRSAELPAERAALGAPLR